MSFPRSFINNIIPHHAVDVVGVYTQGFVQVFRNARPIKATITEESKVMEHPVESGVITTDHRIILPTSIELSMLLNSTDYKDAYNQIRSYWHQGTLLIVQTNSAVYTNQLIASLPHEESPEQYSVLALTLRLKQVQIVTAQYSLDPDDPRFSPVVPTGTQTPGGGGASGGFPGSNSDDAVVGDRVSQSDRDFANSAYAKGLLGLTPTPVTAP